MQCIYKLQSAKTVNDNDNNTFSEECRKSEENVGGIQCRGGGGGG